MVGILYPQLDFTACFLKLLQFTIICHLHWSLAARTLHREDIVQHVINPVLCLYILYCTTVALMGMVDVTGTWTECMRKSLYHKTFIYESTTFLSYFSPLLHGSMTSYENRMYLLSVFISLWFI
jgi:hypothetical protein